MNSFMKAALCGAFLASPMAAQADDCAGVAANTHDVEVLYQGFFPSVIYVCPGDTIKFKNVSGYVIDFSVEDGSDGNSDYDFRYTWTSSGTTREYVVGADSGSRMVNFDVAGYGQNYDGNARIVFGTAPSS